LPSPEDRPFENQYAALKILEKAQSKLEKELSEEGKIIKTSIEHFIGKIHYSTEDRPSAVKNFQKCLLGKGMLIYFNFSQLQFIILVIYYSSNFFFELRRNFAIFDLSQFKIKCKNIANCKKYCEKFSKCEKNYKLRKKREFS